MFITKQKTFFPQLLLTICILSSVLQPELCFSDHNSTITIQARKLVSSINAETAESLIRQLEKLESSLAESQANSHLFLESFIDEINTFYKMSLSVTDACKLVRENFHILEIPTEIKESLLVALELFDPTTEHPSTEPSYEEKTKGHICIWDQHFYWPWEWNYFGLNQRKHSDNKHRCSKSPELTLPNHMAAGFVVALAGALVCILPIPGAQLLGGEMILAGCFFVLEGMADGERPYYVDSETGQEIDRDTSPKIGVGTQF